MASVFAPDSIVTDVVSFFALPLAFALALPAWYGLALFHLAFRLLAPRRAKTSSESRSRPPLGGSFVFLPLGSAAGAIAGIVVAFLAPAHSGWLVWLAYWAVGTVHGALGWRLARAGALTPPEA